MVAAGLLLLLLIPAGIASAWYALTREPHCQELEGDIGTLAVDEERWLKLDPTGGSCDLRFVVINVNRPGKPLEPLVVRGSKFGSARIEGSQVIYSPGKKVEGEDVFVVTYKSALGRDLDATVALKPTQSP